MLCHDPLVRLVVKAAGIDEGWADQLENISPEKSEIRLTMNRANKHVTTIPIRSQGKLE